MKNILSIKDCYGCGVCAISCSKHIISIKLNADGFYTPVIEEENKCTQCGVCVKVCAFTSQQICKAEEHFSILSSASWSNDDVVRKACSSGGVGYELGKLAIHRNYAVCGVKYNSEAHRAEHYVAFNEQELEQSRGSKYIPSYTIPGFTALNRKSKFLVVGTPCQIDSLRRYIRHFKCEDNYLLVDFYCHGVPSMLLWDKYMRTMVPEGVAISDVSWRNKKHGWHDSWVVSLKGENYSFFSPLSKGDLFYRYFLENKCLNKACYYQCKYKQSDSAADIRIGDLWGSAYKDNQQGVSAVLTLSSRGKEWMAHLDMVKIEAQPLVVVQEEQMVTSPPCQTTRRWINLFLLKSALNLNQIHSINTRLDRLEYYKNRILELLK